MKMSTWANKVGQPVKYERKSLVSRTVKSLRFYSTCKLVNACHSFMDAGRTNATLSLTTGSCSGGRSAIIRCTGSLSPHPLPSARRMMQRGQRAPAHAGGFAAGEKFWIQGTQIWFSWVAVRPALCPGGSAFRGCSLYKHPGKDNVEQRQPALLLPRQAKSNTETPGELSPNTYSAESYNLRCLLILNC